jgi:hypothetical protein
MLESRIGVLRLVVASLAACAASLGAPSRCSAQFVGLGTAGAYGIFQIGNNDTLTLGGGDSTTGTADVAVGPTGSYAGRSPGSFTGGLTLDLSASLRNNNFTFSDSITVASLSGAVADYSRALASLAAQGAGTGFAGTTVTGSSDPESQNVFTWTGGNFLLSDTTFTIAGGTNGGANQTFIIGISNGAVNFNNVTVSLTNGVTANHVIFYVTSGDTIISNGSTFEGTLITGNSNPLRNNNITFNDSTLNGALLGSNNITFGTSGTTILNSQPFQSTPEPGSLLLGSILAGLCGTVHYFRRRKTAA